jgi:glycosyltransferase involved in cell wall biosynthesis
LKIAILVDELPTGSAPKIVGEEVYYLKTLGVKCDAYVLRKRDTEVPPTHATEIKLVHLDNDLRFVKDVCGWKIPSFSFFSIYHAVYPFVLSNKASIILDQYDAVIVHFASTAIFASRLNLSRAKLIYYYWDPISYIFAEAYVNWSSLRSRVLSTIAFRLDRYLLRKPDAIILPSKFHLQRLKDLTFEKSIHVVYPGTVCVREIPKERDRFVLAVARWEPGKNPFFLIKLSQKLRELGINDFEFKVVGPWKPPDLKEQFLRMIKQSNLERNFEIAGPKYGDELSKIYLRAGCLIHMKTEAFGFPGLEAAAHGCPMVFPQCSGVTDLFLNGVHGYFPKEGDVEEYAKCVSNFLNEKLAWKMGYESWKIAKLYTWVRHANEIIKTIEGI